LTLASGAENSQISFQIGKYGTDKIVPIVLPSLWHEIELDEFLYAGDPYRQS
jgi:hypothetical protein